MRIVVIPQANKLQYSLQSYALVFEAVCTVRFLRLQPIVLLSVIVSHTHEKKKGGVILQLQ